MSSASTADPRPRTVAFQHDLGIGDLVFRLPYLEAVAKQSHGGKIVLVAQSSARADDLLRGVPWLSGVIVYERGRKTDARGKHRGPIGYLSLVAQVRYFEFERMVIFGDRLRYSFLAYLAGIPVRIGYGGFGVSWLQRVFLNRKPYVKPYKGPCITNYQWATDLMMGHGFCAGPLVPRLKVPDAFNSRWAKELESLPPTRVALVVGASDKVKDWGVANFAALASELLSAGHAVICLGGRAEQQIIESLESRIAPDLRTNLRVLMPPSVLDSAAVVSQCTACIGNDTGMVHVAAACEVPTVLILGHRRLPCHDPAIHSLIAPSVSQVSLNDAFEAVSRIIQPA
jgi:heptosyltransferase-2